MSRVSGNDRADRSSFVTTNVSADRHAAKPAATRPIPVRARQTVINIDPVITHTEGVQTITLSRKALLLRRYPHASHQKFSHLPAMPQQPRGVKIR